MIDESQAPVFEGPYVTYNGRTMFRVIGGDGEEETTEQGSLEEEAAPEAGTPVEPEHDYEKRYKDTQAEYTRVNQEKQALQQWWDALQNPDTQAEALNQLGLELTQEEKQELLDDEQDDFRDPRVDKLEQQLTEFQQQQTAERLQSQIEGEIQGFATGKEVELTDRQLTQIFRDALEVGPEQAFSDWWEDRESISTRAVEQYRQSKKPRNSTPPRPGQSGTPEIPRGDNTAKLALANQIAQEAVESS